MDDLDLTTCTKRCSECSFDPLVVCRAHAPLICSDDSVRMRKLEEVCLSMWSFIAKMPNLFVVTDDEYIEFCKELNELGVIG